VNDAISWNSGPDPEPNAAARGPERGDPSRWEMFVHRGKVKVHQVRRLVSGLREGGAPSAGRVGRTLEHLPVLARSVTPLWTQADPAEWELERGKVENLRVAARALDGVEFPAGGTFSFWAHLGRPTRSRGYVLGRELREGCVVPAVAGGICQLSNALYRVAIDAGFEITERHPHSRRLPGSAAAAGRDATVFWNYVDLRFSHPRSYRFDVRLTRDELIVELRGERRHRSRLFIDRQATRRSQTAGVVEEIVDSCVSCGHWDCPSHAPAAPAGRRSGRAVALVDAGWPEFDQYLGASLAAESSLFVPVAAPRLGGDRYGWVSAGRQCRVQQFPAPTLLRSIHSRRLASQGAERQRKLIDLDDAVASAMGSALMPDHTRAIVSSNLLPGLWRRGHLGGRRFDVLMTRMPLFELQRVLDSASALHPECTTLADFRAPPELVEIEAQALAAAEKIITPHIGVAELFKGRSLLLPWSEPSRLQAPRRLRRRPQLLFPASTVGRKGCHQLRAALLELPRERRPELQWLGAMLEGDGFWRALQPFARPHRLSGARTSIDWAAVDLLVMPAFVEHQPRVLLEAIGRGIPVVASSACGLQAKQGVWVHEAGDRHGLRSDLSDALEVALGRFV
jgi:glycosyltransferase involved in cell wall biosynthesis